MERTTESRGSHDDSSRQADSPGRGSVPDQGGCPPGRPERRAAPPAAGPSLGDSVSSARSGSPSLQKEGHYTCSIRPTELWLELVGSGAPESQPGRHPQRFCLQLGGLGMGLGLPSLPGSPLQPRRGSGSGCPGSTSDLPVLSRVPSPPSQGSRGGSAPGRRGGDSSPVSGAGDRAQLLATPRGEHREARSFIALGLVDTPFGAGCKPA
ncbi:putative cuticle collagen 145 [Canis lupus dingo]|uniref:putative cuticle collagen 145 n=1 Tax=Canis lupus dingo TaxID=286419 RepID=UPI0020C403F5|nr:putative cuticle collagen 145 [Canis lupus dingo]